MVAPLTAVVGALVPVAWALLTGERPSAVVLTGAACAIAAGGLIAREHAVAAADAPAPRGVAGVGHAVARGRVLRIVDRLVRRDGGRVGVLALAHGPGGGSGRDRGRRRGLVRARDRLPPPVRPVRALAAGVGALDVCGAVLLLVAIRHGLLVVVAPVVALAPAFTVVLSWFLLHERVSRFQLVGLGLALIGLVLIASG